MREPGVYVIEGPMGCGKTEAALAAAYQLIAAGKAAGLYFALPTQVTSNRIHLRVQPFVERISEEPMAVRLAHAASWLVESELPPRLRPASPDAEAEQHVRVGRSWFASPKRALLAPFGVGTVDQALLGVVAAKHFFVRQFGLAGKVVVLDEVHTYDLYTSTLIDALVQRLRELHCTVLVLSATLTKARRQQLLGVDDRQPLSDAYPLLSRVGSRLEEVACDAPPAKTFEVALFSTCVGSQRGGFLLSANLGKMVVMKGTIRQTLRKEPPVLIMQDALPLFKSFLKPVSLKQHARQLVLRCVIAFLMHLGKMSASRVAGDIRTDARHRLKSVDSWDAAIGGDAICSANCVPNCSKWKRGKGRSSSTSIKPTVASKVSSPKTRSSAAKKQSAPRRARTSRRSTRSDRPTVS